MSDLRKRLLFVLMGIIDYRIVTYITVPGINPEALSSFFEDQVAINKNLIDEKYENEQSNYKTEETREILQITTQDLDKANLFMELIKKGNNFDEVAKKNFNILK